MTIPSIAAMPHMTASEFRKTIKPALDKLPAAKRPQYAVCAYDTCEEWQWKAVIVTGKVTEPTVLRQASARSNKRPRAILVPHIDAITVELAQAITHVVTDYQTLRTSPEAGGTLVRRTLPRATSAAAAAA